MANPDPDDRFSLVVYERDAAVFVNDADESLYLRHFHDNEFIKDPWAHCIDPYGVVHLTYVLEWAREVGTRYPRYVRWTTASILRCAEQGGRRVPWPLVRDHLTCLVCIASPP